MSPREVARRDARLAELSRIRVPTPSQQAEYERLIAWRDGVWKRLPGRIARLRHNLRQLERQADALGLGPC